MKNTVFTALGTTILGTSRDVMQECMNPQPYRGNDCIGAVIDLCLGGWRSSCIMVMHCGYSMQQSESTTKVDPGIMIRFPDLYTDNKSTGIASRITDHEDNVQQVVDKRKLL